METKNKNQDFVLWAGRLGEKPCRAAFAFQSSIAVDKRMVNEDIAGSIAHCKMLASRGVISGECSASLVRELRKIQSAVKDGTLQIDENFEDIHSFIESILTERLGDAGRMVHSGRSRNDQVAVDFRLYLKESVLKIIEEVKSAIDVLLDIAGENTETIMSEYTHLQRAQCGTLAHWLCAYACALLRDAGRFKDALSRLDECPLGACALAGTSLPLDREETARELGFARPTLNSMDSVSDRDFAVEIGASCAIIQTHLSRFCEDIILWASEEFKFVELAESWSTGSSIMPQKKNPDFAELIRGKAGRVTGNLVTLLTILKGLPYGYGKDLQEDKEALFDSIDTVCTCLVMYRGMMASTKWNKQKMAVSCTGGFLEATDAAEYLVRKGMPFRSAHTVSAALVRTAISRGANTLCNLTLADFKKESHLFEEDIFEVLKPLNCVRSRTLPGGPAPREIIRQIEVLRREAARLICSE